MTFLNLRNENLLDFLKDTGPDPVNTEFNGWKIVLILIRMKMIHYITVVNSFVNSDVEEILRVKG